MTIDGKLMRAQAWTPFFITQEEILIVLVWTLLPGPPLSCLKNLSSFPY